MHRPRIVDFSLALVNRTGAYHIGSDLLSALPGLFQDVRYWRFHLPNEPRGLLRVILAKAMAWELRHVARLRHEKKAALQQRHYSTLYLDPLYALISHPIQSDIVLCHDIGPITNPELFDDTTVRIYNDAYSLIKRRAPRIIFVSQFSKNEFAKAFGTNFPSLDVIPLYTRPTLKNGAHKRPLGVTTPFLLTVGGTETRKNHLRIIDAFAQSELISQGYSLVICGPRGNVADQVERKVKTSQGVIQLGFVSDEEIRWLYSNAAGLIMPSLLEGFGLPSLEAAYFGLLSVLGTNQSQHETVGDAAIYVDPYSVSDIAAGMRNIVHLSSDLRDKKLHGARQHAQSLSFDRFIARWETVLSA